MVLAEIKEKTVKCKWRVLTRFLAPVSLFTVVPCTGGVSAQTFSESRWAQETTHAGEFLSNLANIIMYGLLAISFCAGTGLIVWGFVVMANKDNNPQGAQGAWKKVAFGGCLVSTSAILGIIKATMTASAG